MMRSPSSTAVAAAGNLPAGPEGVLQVLRDELFAVETDRLSGKLPETEYQQLKAAYDIILKRAISRKGTVEVIPE
jgi:hypothetical protein